MCVCVCLCVRVLGKGVAFCFVLFQFLPPPKLDYIAYNHLDGKWADLLNNIQLSVRDVPYGWTLIAHNDALTTYNWSKGALEHSIYLPVTAGILPAFSSHSPSSAHSSRPEFPWANGESKQWPRQLPFSCSFPCEVVIPVLTGQSYRRSLNQLTWKASIFLWAKSKCRIARGLDPMLSDHCVPPRKNQRLFIPRK